MTIHVRSLFNVHGLQAVATLRRGPLRFGQLQKAMGAHNNCHCQTTLRKLERDGLILRRALGDFQHQGVEYSLTDFGLLFARSAEPLLRWVTDNVETVEDNRAAFNTERNNARAAEQAAAVVTKPTKRSAKRPATKVMDLTR
jgi:DNA-binding HxlR family transcriptional regulator